MSLVGVHFHLKEESVSHSATLFYRLVGWRQDNGNRSNQKSKFDFLATRQRLVKIDGFEGSVPRVAVTSPNGHSNTTAQP